MERKPITEFMKKEILHRQHNRCSTIPDYTCPFRGDIFDRSGYHIDHVLPLADGGEDELPNLQALCLCCHRVKTDREQHTRAKGTKYSKKGSNNTIADPDIEAYAKEFLNCYTVHKIDSEYTAQEIREDFKAWRSTKIVKPSCSLKGILVMLTRLQGELAITIESDKILGVLSKKKYASEQTEHDSILQILEERFIITRNIRDTIPVRKIIDHLHSSGIVQSPAKIGLLLNTLITLPDDVKAVKQSHGVQLRVGIKEKGGLDVNYSESENEDTAEAQGSIDKKSKRVHTKVDCPYCPWQNRSHRLPGHLITRHSEHVTIRKGSYTKYLQAYITHVGKKTDFVVCLSCKKGIMSDGFGPHGSRWDTNHMKREDCLAIHDSLLAEWKANQRAHRDSVIQHYTDISENTIVLV